MQWSRPSLQNMRNFGYRVLSKDAVNHNSHFLKGGRPGRERNLYQGVTDGRINDRQLVRLTTTFPNKTPALEASHVFTA